MGFLDTIGSATGLWNSGGAGVGTAAGGVDYAKGLNPTDNQEVIKRLSGRRTCSGCGKGYHIIFSKPVRENVCDVCGMSLVQRDDDSELTILNRLDVYEQQTSSLKEYFKK